MSIPDRLPPGPLHDDLTALVKAHRAEQDQIIDVQRRYAARQEVLDRVHTVWQGVIQAPARRSWEQATERLGELPMHRVTGSTNGISADWKLQNTKLIEVDANEPLASADMAIEVHARVDEDSPKTPRGLLYAVMLAGDNRPDTKIPPSVQPPEDHLLGVWPKVGFMGKRSYPAELIRPRLPKAVAAAIGSMNMHVSTTVTDPRTNASKTTQHGASVSDVALRWDHRPKLTVPEHADPVYKLFMADNPARTEADMTPDIYLRIINSHAESWGSDWDLKPYMQLGQLCFVLDGARPVVSKPHP